MKKFRDVVIFAFIILTFFVVLGILPFTASAQNGIDITDNDETELNKISIDINPINMTDIEGFVGKNGQLRYKVNIKGQVKKGNYPILYPVNIEYYDTTNTKIENSTKIGSQNIILKPTSPDSFVPGVEGSILDERVMQETRNVTIAFDSLFNRDSENFEREVTAQVKSIRTEKQSMDVSRNRIKGDLPDGVFSGIVTQDSDFGVTSSVSFVDSYRISEDRQNPRLGENLFIPSPSYTDLRGDIEDFQKSTLSLDGFASVSGDNGISMVTLTNDVSRGSPHTISITYKISQGDRVKLQPIDPTGQEIIKKTEYVLPSKAEEKEQCKSIEVDDSEFINCVYYLHNEESNSISQLGELVLHYESEQNTDFVFGCQSIISGYLSIGQEACGVNPFDQNKNINIDPITFLEIEGIAGDKNRFGNLEDLENGSWSSDKATVTSIQGNKAKHNIRYKVKSNLDGAINEDQSVYIYNSDDLTPRGFIRDDATPVISTNIDDEYGEWQYYGTEKDFSTSESKEYIGLLCNTNDGSRPEDCNINSNEDSDSILFAPPSINGKLVIDQPTIINKLPISEIEDKFKIGTERVETPDEDFDENNDGWNKVSDDPIIENFDGRISQVVTLTNQDEESISVAEEGNLVEEFPNSRISGAVEYIDGNWNISVQTTQIGSKERYIPKGEDISDYNMNSSNWIDVTNINTRTVQTGSKLDTFPFVLEDSFSSKVNSQKRWYPPRSGISTPKASFVLDTVIQREDPDVCLNCLPSETKETAKKRLRQSSGNINSVIEIPGENVWNAVSNEEIIRTGKQLDVNFFRRATPSAGEGLFYWNLEEDRLSENRYRFRQPKYNNIELKEWQFRSDISEAPFRRPTTNQTDRYINSKYDITYTLTANVNNSDLYAYEKDIKQQVVNYEKGHIAWIDLSQSESKEFYKYDLKFEGAEESISVDWIQGLHSIPTNQRDEKIRSTCDNKISDSYDNNLPVTTDSQLNINDSSNSLEYLSERQSGIGGNAVVQTCNIDGDEKIVRVGKEYTEPGVYTYKVDVQGLSGRDQSTTGYHEVLGEKPKGQSSLTTPDVGSSPSINDIQPINKRVNFDSGTVAFEGSIISGTHKLDQSYELTVSPADNIKASSLSCNELGSYRSETSTEVTQKFNSGESFIQTESCIRENNEEEKFEHRSRFVNYRYESVPKGIITSCEEIPVTGEDNTHNGYKSVNKGDKTICRLNDTKDIGPTNFTISEESFDSSNDQIEIEYQKIPAGAFRGSSFVDNKNPKQCISTRIEEDGSLICNLRDEGEVRYGIRQIGEWTSTSNSSQIYDKSKAKKSVWNGKYVIPTAFSGDTWESGIEEEFTAVVNPRQTGTSINQLTDNKLEFTFELREKTTGKVIDTEKSQVILCSSNNIKSLEELPKNTLHQNECKNFDTLLTGLSDWQSNKFESQINGSKAVKSVDKAVQDYVNTDDISGNSISDRSEKSYVITSAANDACPDSRAFPRDQETLIDNIDKFTYTIDADSVEELSQEEERIERQLIQDLRGQYSITGDPCKRSTVNIEQPTPVKSSQKSNFSITFDKQQLLEQENSNNFTRFAGLSDLHQIVANPVQSRWSSNDLGSAIRMGTPVLLKESAENSSDVKRYPNNKNLIAHYPFDHNSSEHTTITNINGESVVSVPNHFVIQDVGLLSASVGPDGTETDIFADFQSNDYKSQGIYNARLWYGSPCHKGHQNFGSDSIFNPSSFQPISGLGPIVNREQRSKSCNNILNSELASNISDYRFSTNPITDLNKIPNSYSNSVTGIDSNSSKFFENVPKEQSAYLPVPPEDEWKQKYSINNESINDAYKSVQNNYVDGGVFGGNAIKLDKTSWIMLSPPCYPAGPSCNDNDVGSDEPWRGGWINSYTNPENQISSSSSIQSQIKDEYTISFWINSEESFSDDQVSYNNGENVAPTDNILSVSYPAEDQTTKEDSVNSILSTSQLSVVEVPQRIYVGDLSNEEMESISEKYSTVDKSDEFVKPVAWDYPSHFNLRDTARACQSVDNSKVSFGKFTSGNVSLKDSNRPIMCEIFEASDSKYASDYSNLRKFDGSKLKYPLREPAYLDDFRKEMIGKLGDSESGRIEWSTRYEWPAGYLSDSGTTKEGFPKFDVSNIYSGKNNPEDCYHAMQRNCYDQGRYLYGSGDVDQEYMNGSSNVMDASKWQHMALSYDKNNGLRVYINGDLESKISGQNTIEMNDKIPQEDLILGELYNNGVVSLGAVYQGAGHNLNPNNFNSTNHKPYIHSSRSDVLIDELRIYNSSLESEQIKDREIPDIKYPDEHSLESNTGLYTSEFRIEDPIQSGIENNLENQVGDKSFYSWEFEINSKSQGPATYSIDIIPCDGSECANEESVRITDSKIPDDLESLRNRQLGNIERYNDNLSTIYHSSTDMGLNPTSRTITFSKDKITDTLGSDSQIDGFKFNISLGTPYIDSTPVIRDITASPVGDQYRTCQEIAENHPGSSGLYGSKFNIDLLDKNGNNYEGRCDMSTAGGEWTRFAWMDTSNNTSFEHDIEPSEPLFTEQVSISDCDPSDNACFATADYSSIGDEEYPQVMIKTFDNGSTRWAALELQENVHKVNENNLGVDNIGIAEKAVDIFEGETIEHNPNAPFSMAGQDISESISPVGVQSGLYEECIHPIDNSQNMPVRCISHIHSSPEGERPLSDGKTSVIMAGIENQRGASTINERLVDIKVDFKEQNIEKVECLGEDVERCEFYYRTGNSSES